MEVLIIIFGIVLFWLIVFAALGLLYCIYMLIKNERTWKCNLIIINAIYNYHIDMDYDPDKIHVEFDDMCSYDETLYRYFDWGYKHILPPDKYEIIKPYIREV